MPPRKAQQNTATRVEDEANATTSSFNATTQVVMHTQRDEDEPSKKAAAGITQAQKQVLIDNLQQEITDRARRLRAQYALQAQNIRTRLEMRVNRIPMAMRKKRMQDLMDEHVAKTIEPKPAAPVFMQTQKPAEEKALPPVRESLKRHSDQISSADEDKENESQSQDLQNPKKRTKTTANAASGNVANTKAARATAASRKPGPGAVLSPRSHNSRTMNRSPLKAAGKITARIARLASPSKAPLAAGAKDDGGQGNGGQGQAKTARKTTRRDDSGRSSDASNTSAGTTIVNTKAAKGRAPVAKKAASTTAKAGTVGKRAATVKKENVPPTSAAAPAGGRSLRKRA